ncbi:hypothetical protein COL20_14415, partial [Bacillus sp. AFS075034]
LYVENIGLVYLRLKKKVFCKIMEVNRSELANIRFFLYVITILEDKRLIESRSVNRSHIPHRRPGTP